jgi:hypothetical protein
METTGAIFKNGGRLLTLPLEFGHGLMDFQRNYNSMRNMLYPVVADIIFSSKPKAK